MFECGFITKQEVRCCINYLLCHREYKQSVHFRAFQGLHLEYTRFSQFYGWYDKRTVWESFFCNNEILSKIMAYRRIESIDHLLYRAWDYYGLDVPDHSLLTDDLTSPVVDDIMKTDGHNAVKLINGGTCMLTAEQFKGLKKVNVSKNPELSRTRLKEDFSNASREQQRAIVELSGLKRTSIYNAYKTGAISARVALAIAQVLKVSPFYYTGEEKSRQPLQDAILLLFLEQHGYKKLLAELGEGEQQRTKRQYNRKPKDAAQNAEQVIAPPSDNTAQEISQETNTINTHLSLPDSPEMRQAMAELSDEDAVMLLKALFARSKAGGQAAQYAELVRRLLLS